VSEEVQDGKMLNRWIIVAGAVLIQVALGAIYAWSVFTKKITIPLDEGGQYGFSAAQAFRIFEAGLVVFALVMLYAGRWQARIGPRKVALVGGFVLGIGYILGGLLGKTFLTQLICIGIIGGAGIGLTYVVPIAVCVKWFPDHKGLITGLAVAGFGFGATIWVKLGDSWFGGLLNTTNVFGLPGVQSVYFIYGLAFLGMIFLGSMVMINPPAGWKPADWDPDAVAARQKNNVGGHVNLSAGQMVQTPQYWGLTLMFFGSSLAGLMVISCIRLFGIDSLQANIAGMDTAAAGKVAGTAMALYAILNGLGRISWGKISDTIGRRMSLLLMCLFQSIMMLFFFKVGGSKAGLIVGACIIGFNFGGNFALFPTATADFFGNKNVGSNYPWVFLAYGAAAIAGPEIAAYFKDHAVDVNSWKIPFMIAGISCLVAAILGLLLKAPNHAEETAPLSQETEPA
jgi:MFS family permease